MQECESSHADGLEAANRHVALALHKGQQRQISGLAAIFWIGQSLVEALYDANTSIAHSACLSLLLQGGLKIEDRYHRGCAALISAAASSKFNAARILLGQGACINTSDHIGRTPLMFAARAELDERMRT